MFVVYSDNGFTTIKRGVQLKCIRSVVVMLKLEVQVPVLVVIVVNNTGKV